MPSNKMKRIFLSIIFGWECWFALDDAANADWLGASLHLGVASIILVVFLMVFNDKTNT